jgi:hypothetical protein
VAIAGALLLPAISECLASSMPQAQAEQCCDGVTCAPSDQKQACLPTTPAPSHGWLKAPEVRALDAPSLLASIEPPAQELLVPAWAPADLTENTQHPPPKLYTLHLALLI